MKIGQHARLVAGVVVGLVVAGGTAFATTSDSSGTETAACITPSKYIRILPEDAECRSREVAISLPSMDTIAAIEGVVNENSDAFDAFLADNEEALTDLADLVNANGSDIFTLQGDLAAEVENRTAADEDLAATFDNYYTSEDLDGFLAEIYDGFGAVAEGLDSKASNDDVAILNDATTSAINTVLEALEASDDVTFTAIEQTGAALDEVTARVDAVESTLALLSDVDNLGSTVSALQASIDSLTSGQAAANAAAAANADAIDSLSASIAAALAQRDAAIDALTARVAALEAANTPAP